MYDSVRSIIMIFRGNDTILMNILLLIMMAVATQVGPVRDPGLVQHLREGKFFAMPFPIGVLHTWCLLAPPFVLTCFACQQQQVCRWGRLAGRPARRAARGVVYLFVCLSVCPFASCLLLLL